MTGSQIGSAIDRTLHFNITSAIDTSIYNIGTVNGTSYYKFIVSSSNSVVYFEILGTEIVNIMSSGTGAFSLLLENNIIMISGLAGDLDISLLYTTGLFTFSGEINSASPTLISRNFNISYYPITLSTSSLEAAKMTITDLVANNLKVGTINLTNTNWTISCNDSNQLIIK